MEHEVAEQTGLSKGTLYLYFKNKHDLSLALLERVIPISYGLLSIAFRNRHVQQALKKYPRRYSDSLVPIVRSGAVDVHRQEMIEQALDEA